MYTDLFQAFSFYPGMHPHEAIRNSIEVVLNAREGCVAYPTCLGTPDFIDSMSRGYFDKLQRVIVHQIQRNESRVKNVVCRLLTQKKSLSSTHYELLVTLLTGEVLDMRIETTGAGGFLVQYPQ